MESLGVKLGTRRGVLFIAAVARGFECVGGKDPKSADEEDSGVIEAGTMAGEREGPEERLAGAVANLAISRPSSPTLP